MGVVPQKAQCKLKGAVIGRAGAAGHKMNLFQCTTTLTTQAFCRQIRHFNIQLLGQIKGRDEKKNLIPKEVRT